MKKHLLLYAILLFCCAACARVSLFSELDEARKEAAKRGRPILALFSPESANMLSARFVREILESPAFIKEAGRHFTLFIPDIGSPSPQQEGLTQNYGIQQFPAILLLDSSGRTYALYDYIGEDWLTLLNQLIIFDSQLEKRDELLRNAVRENDPEKRLAAFAEAISVFSAWGIIGNYPELKTEAIRLDEDNRAGLRAKYSVERAIGEISVVHLSTNGFEPGLAALRELLAEYPEGEAAQQIYYVMAALESRLGRLNEARRLFQSAIRAAPSSTQVEMIRANLRSLDFNPD